MFKNSKKVKIPISLPVRPWEGEGRWRFPFWSKLWLFFHLILNSHRKLAVQTSDVSWLHHGQQFSLGQLHIFNSSNNALEEGNYMNEVGEWEVNIFLVTGRDISATSRNIYQESTNPKVVQHHMNFQEEAIASSKIRHASVMPLWHNSDIISISWDAPVGYALPVIR